MRTVFFALIISFVSLTYGQQCEGTFNEELIGQCSSINQCQGTILAVNTCSQSKCCVNATSRSSSNTCITGNDFDILYNTTRATFLRTVLNYGINSAGICNNCQAKAAFLAVAATMTNNFETDEVIATDAQFAADDTKYGNTETGDGSLFRRRGLFGLRGREMYRRLQTLMPQYQTLTNPESVSLTRNAIEIAVLLWRNPDLQTGSSLTQYADGTFYGFSMLWYKLTEDIELLSDAAKQYSKFLQQLQCGGTLYPGQGPVCQYNVTHNGSCSPDCIKGLEEAGEWCGCSSGQGSQCPNSPVHIRCCLDTCMQELKMDLGFVLDASFSIAPNDYQLQLQFTKDLLRQANVGQNKTHVGIINYSSELEVLTWLNTDYDLQGKLGRVDEAHHLQGGTNTAAALQNASDVFSFEHGLRRPEEGATQVIFVITDGASANQNATIQAATALKNKGITLVSVGVGTGRNLVELHAICTPPASENYFSISNYAALTQKLNQFTSKSCSEPTPVSPNVTVIGEIGKNKYKFLKIEVVLVGNKILITIKLFNGKVKLFHSFTTRNPKDPEDFNDYQSKSNVLQQSFWTKLISKNVRAESDEVTLVIDKPDNDVEYVYLGVKGVEEDNQFEVKFDDCAKVDCNPKTPSPSSSLTIKSTAMLLVICTAIFFSFYI